jgi:hypothetical protein
MNKLIIFICALALALSGQAYAGKGARNAAILGIVGIGAYQLGKQSERNKHRAPRYGRAYARSPMEQAFRSQSRMIRKEIQVQLQQKGFYRSYIDGYWGRGTSGAMESYAIDAGKTHLLTTNHGANELISSLLRREDLQPRVNASLDSPQTMDRAPDNQGFNDLADEPPPVDRAPDTQALDDLADVTVDKSGTADELVDIKRKIDIAGRQLTLLRDMLRVQEMREGIMDAYRVARIDALKARIAAIDRFQEQTISGAEARYDMPIRPVSTGSGATASKVARIFPKIPYFTMDTDEIAEMRISPRVTNKGVLVYEFNFMEPGAGFENVRETIPMHSSEVNDVMLGLEKAYGWSEVAREKGVRQRHEKVAACFPQNMCSEKKEGNSSTEVVFTLSEDGTTGAKIQRNKGTFASGYDLSIDSALILASYLDYMKKVGEAEYSTGAVTNADLDTLFK